MTDLIAYTKDYFESGILPAANGLGERKKAAFEQFLASGFPTTRMEDWKYTSVSGIVNAPYEIMKNAGGITKKDFDHFPFTHLDAWYLVFVNGHYQPELSNNRDIPHPFTIANLAGEGTKDKIEKYFNSMATMDSGFTALNTAMATDGAFIHLPANTTAGKPVFIVFIADSREGSPLIQPRNIIIAEENSEVQVVEMFVSAGDHPGLTNIVTEVSAARHARVDYTKLQLEGDHNAHVSTKQFVQYRESSVTTHVLSLNGGFIRNNLNFLLKEKNCNTLLNGLYLPNGKQFVDNHTVVDHAVPECISNQLYKGILNDSATGVFNGKVLVRKDAQKTNAYQRNMNILLTDEATINTKPQLEIFADDVRCTHGATSGQIDEDAVFYLRSRGIGEENAKALLMNAFANEIIEPLKIEGIKEPLKKLILRKLKAKF